jgi:formylglycine-generating enzyme required for sulfatase activity
MRTKLHKRQLLTGSLTLIVLLSCRLSGFSEEVSQEMVATQAPTLTKTVMVLEHTLTPTETVLPVPTSTPTQAPALEIGSTLVNPVDGAVMVFVPEGEFLMGSEEGLAQDNEKPEHLVYLDAFWIYQHEVTNAQFALFIEATGHQTTVEERGWSFVFDGNASVREDGAYWGAPEGPGSSIAGREDHPVVHMSWSDAQAYCEWAGGQLPTEAEWEKAARSIDGRLYPWGNTQITGDKANFCDVNCRYDWAESLQDDGYEGTAPVGSFPAGVSPYGALDMLGNVWEWVADWYDADYYSHSPYENPTGPASGEFRVKRGGSEGSVIWSLRVSSRFGLNPGAAGEDYGFRCAHPGE